MPWKKTGSMKYELVETLAHRLSPSCNEVATKTMSISPSSKIMASSSPTSSVDTEASSYAASLRSHFAQYDSERIEQIMEESCENVEPNITRHFTVRSGACSHEDTSRTSPNRFEPSSYFTEKVLERDDHEALSVSTPETASQSSDSLELREFPKWIRDETNDPQELDDIVEVGSSSTPTTLSAPVSERHIRHLRKVIEHSIVEADEEELAKALRKVADSCLDKMCPLRSLLVDHGAVAWIAQALQAFPESSSVTSKALRALQNITCGSVLARDMLHRLHGPALICHAMTEHVNDNKVQRDGCGVLLNFLLNDPDATRSEAFVRVGGIDAVLAAMDCHPNEMKLCEWASRCIRALCKTCKHHRPAVWNKGGFTAILNAQERHPSCHGIQKAARSATRMFWDEYEAMVGDAC